MSSLSPQMLSIQLPRGRLGATVERSADGGACVVSSKTSEATPLQVGDVIVSLNGIQLVDVEGGAAAWEKLFQVFCDGDRMLVVQRAAGLPLSSSNEMEHEASTNAGHEAEGRLDTTTAAAPMGAENVPMDHKDAPVPPAQLDALQEERNEAERNDEMDKAINAVINDSSDAPMTAAQIAAFYEEREDAKCMKTRPEVIDDGEPPVGHHFGQDDSKGKPTVGSAAQQMQQPADIIPPIRNRAGDEENPSNSNGGEQAAQETRNPQQSPMLPGQSEQSVGTPRVEAWPVEDEPSLPVAEVVPVSDRHGDGDQTALPWWKRHQRFIILALLLIIAALVAVLGASLLSRGGDNSGVAPAAVIGPSMRPTTKQPTEVLTLQPVVDTPTVEGTAESGVPSHVPTRSPSQKPALPSTPQPTETLTPTHKPTPEPALPSTPQPTETLTPTHKPTPEPVTKRPTRFPTRYPMKRPTLPPSPFPTRRPSGMSIAYKSPTRRPTSRPTLGLTGLRPSSSAPRNNDCAEAETIPWPGELETATISGSTIGATSDIFANIPSGCDSNPNFDVFAKGVWYVLTLPSNRRKLIQRQVDPWDVPDEFPSFGDDFPGESPPFGGGSSEKARISVSFSTCNQADFDTTISVYRSSSINCSNLQCVAGVNNSEGCRSGTELRVSLDEQSTCYVHIHGGSINGNTGSFSLTVTMGSFNYEAAIVIGRPFVDGAGASLQALPIVGSNTASWQANILSKDSASTKTFLKGNATSLGSEWIRRGLGEHASVASFAAFAIALMTNHAPADLLEDALAAGLDEVRHARTSFDIASKIIGTEVGPGPMPDSMHEFNNNLTALALAVAREGCVDETLAAFAAAVEAEHISEILERGLEDSPYSGIDLRTLANIRNELFAIAMDESRHSALAWKTLDWVCGVDLAACIAVYAEAFGERKLEAKLIQRADSILGDSPKAHRAMIVEWEKVYKACRRDHRVPKGGNDLKSTVCDGGGAAASGDDRSGQPLASVTESIIRRAGCM